MKNFIIVNPLEKSSQFKIYLVCQIPGSLCLENGEFILDTYSLKKTYPILLYTSVFFVYYALSLFLSIPEHRGPIGPYFSDMPSHIEVAIALQNHPATIMSDFEPLLHIVVIIFNFIIQGIAGHRSMLNYVNAMALTMALAKVAEFLITQKIVEWRTDLSPSETLFLTCLINISTGIFLPFITAYNYVIYGSPNILHNPTTILLLPVAVTFFYFYVTYYLIPHGNASYRKSVLLGILLLVATLIKPSFTNIMLVVMAIYYLTHPKRFSSRFLGYDLIIYLPSCVLLLLQLISMSVFYTHSANMILFTPFKVQKYFSEHTLIPLFQVLVFPLLIAVLYSFRASNRPREYILYTWVFIIIAYPLYILLSFDGPGWADGNLRWSCCIGLSLLYLFAIIDYANFLKNIDTLQFRIPFFNKPGVKKTLTNTASVCLYLSFLSGSYQLITVFMGGSSW